MHLTDLVTVREFLAASSEITCHLEKARPCALLLLAVLGTDWAIPSYIAPYNRPFRRFIA
jgi:hypothetical protein